jgi:hypothetical protein
MKWFRSNIKPGAYLALLALVVQFALSFGHFHGIAAQAAPALQSSLQPLPASNQDSDQHPGEACAICTVVAMANATLFAMPPVLPLPQVVEPKWLFADAAFVDLKPARSAFQPRAPPLS